MNGVPGFDREGSGQPVSAQRFGFDYDVTVTWMRLVLDDVPIPAPGQRA